MELAVTAAEKILVMLIIALTGFAAYKRNNNGKGK